MRVSYKLGITVLAILLLMMPLLTACTDDEEITKAYAHFIRGMELYEDGLYDEAVEEYTKAIELYPNYATAYDGRGSAYADKGQYDLAVADFTKAIEIDPHYIVPYFNRGLSYRAQGEKAKAIADLEKFITLADNHEWIDKARSVIEELSE